MDSDDDVTYRVVLNHEEQYSIWPADREPPAGWRDEGTVGTKQECMSHIDEVWTDMRPLSLRLHMERAQAEEVARQGEDDDGGYDEPEDDEDSLVRRLCREDHPVEISLRPERTGPALREAVERGYVFVRFTDTRGGTELGLRLDRDATDVSDADFDQPSGRIVVVGDLTLDFEPVRCTAEIDIATMAGRGRLALREPAE